MSKIDEDLKNALQATMDAALADRSEAVNKAVRGIADDLESDLMYRVQDDLAANLTGWVMQMAERAVEQMLAGNEDQMRRYLSCDKRAEDGEYIGWTGRSDSKVFRQTPRGPRVASDHPRAPIRARSRRAAQADR